jgi:hypothetical protein
MELNNNINKINNITNSFSSLNIADYNSNSNSNTIDIVETKLKNDLENDDNHYFNNMNLDNYNYDDDDDEYKKENEIIQVYNNLNMKICISKKEIRDIQYLKEIICSKYNEIHNQFFYPANLRISDINGNEIKYLYQLNNKYYLFISIIPINCNLHI